MIGPIHSTDCVEDAAAWAEACFQRHERRLRADPFVSRLLADLEEAVSASSEAMGDAGLKELCRECEEEEGGSCCGKGIERRYDGVLLLINRLLGIPLPMKRMREGGCFFLGEQGCVLKARHVLCVNYLCEKVKQTIPHERVLHLKEKEGKELEAVFRLHDRINRLLIEIQKIEQCLAHTARFFDERKKGDIGALGFRRSTRLAALVDSMDLLVREGILRFGETKFLDMGCADGRVNVLMSYCCRLSVGVEIDEWTLEEYGPLRKDLDASLASEGLLLPPDNILFVSGDMMDERVHEDILRATSLRFEDFDLFFTYLTMHEEFGGLVARKGRRGAVFMVYGMDLVLPKLPGLTLLDGISPLENKLVLYRKD